MTTKLLVVDDHETFREGLIKLVEGTEIRVVAHTGSNQEAIDLVREHDPDVVLIDIGMEDRMGQAVLRRIKQDNPQLAVIVFSENGSLSQMTRAHALQADGWLSKRCNWQELLATVRCAASGQSVWSREQIRRLTGPLVTHRLDNATNIPLTPRQSEVLRHIASGLTTKEIANTLDIRYNTAKEHVQNVMRKIGVAGRTEAAVWAVRKGLV